MIQIFALLLSLFSTPALAQCTGNFPSNTVCGNATGFTGQPKPTVSSAFGGGGGGSLSITRAQIATTNIGPNQTIITNGYRTTGDLGAGAVYSSFGGSCPSGWGAITDSGGNCFNLVLGATGQVTPGMFGAYGTNGTQTISAGDVSANTQWRGTYTAGMTWDYVAVQEAMYAAWGQASTPGSIVWNSVAGTYGTANIPMVVQCGTYNISNRLFSIIYAGKITFCGKQGALFKYTGTHPSSVWLCDHCTYTQFYSVAIQDGAIQSAGTALPAFDVDSTAAGTGAAGLVQQNTYYDLFINTGQNGVGMAINLTSGNQGDTQTWVNPIFIASGVAQDTCLIISGANSLNETIIGGDLQGCLYQGIQVNGGQLLAYGTHMENQNLSPFSAAPLTTQFTTFGADLNYTAQVIGSSASVISGFRSESNVLLAGGQSATLINGGVDLIGSSVIGGDVQSWGGLVTAVPTGIVVNDNSNGQNTKHRSFMMVDNSGTGWNPITGGGGTNTIQDSTASYTVNQWAGERVFIRFSSSGTYSSCSVASNTATTITYTGCPALLSQHFYQIAGQQGATEPNWDTVPNGFQAGFNANAQGFGTQPGSTCVGVSFTGQIHVNDYVVIPQADELYSASQFPNEKIFLMPLYAKVTAVNGSTPCGTNPGGQTGSVTVNRAATVAVVNGPGYFGTPIADPNSGLTKWINIPVTVAVANKIIDMTTWSTSGIATIGSVDQLKVGSTGGPWQDASANYNVPAPGGFVSYEISAKAGSKCADLTAAATIDVTSVAFGCNSVSLTPTSNTTLNAPLPPAFGAQDMLIFIKTSGTTPYTITFGTNFNSNGTFNTGAVNAAVFAILFRSNGTVWQEVSRSTVSKASASGSTLVASPTAPNSTSVLTMQGLAGSITPVKTGNVIITINGHITTSNTAAGDGIVNQISYGTGAAPTSNAAVTGTQVGGQQEYMIPATVTAADVFVPFSLTAVVTGLTPGTAYWVDLASKAVAATGQANNQVNISVIEF